MQGLTTHQSTSTLKGIISNSISDLEPNRIINEAKRIAIPNLSGLPLCWHPQPLLQSLSVSVLWRGCHWCQWSLRALETWQERHQVSLTILPYIQPIVNFNWISPTSGSVSLRQLRCSPNNFCSFNVQRSTSASSARNSAWAPQFRGHRPTLPSAQPHFRLLYLECWEHQIISYQPFGASMNSAK